MSKSKRHILFSVGWYPNDSGYLSSSFVKKHAEAISLYDRISVLGVFSISNNYKIKVQKKSINKNLNEYIVYVPKFQTEKNSINKVLAGSFYAIGYIIGLLRIIINEKRISVMHVNILTRSGLIPLLLNKAFSIPYVISEHWTRYYPQKSFPSNKIHLTITKSIVRNAEYVLCAANKQIAAMKSHGLRNNNYYKFHNTYDPTLFYPQENKSKHITFVTIAMFREHSKNISGILEVIKELEAHYNFKHLFIGNGDDFKATVQYAKQLQLSSVEFLGLLEAKDISKHLSLASASVLFSNFENQPVSIIESLACGTPVIATDVGDVKEMIPEKCGVVIQAKDKEALYNEMVNIIEGEDHFSSSTCINEAQKYSLKSVGKEFSDLYSKILDN